MSQGFDSQTFDYKRETLATYTAKTFGWMFLGLMVTFVAAIAFYASGMLYALYSIAGGMFAIILALVELGVVIYLSARLHKLSVGTARALFFLYALLNAITLSSIFVIYRMDSLIFAFAMTALYFGVMALYGYFTKTDLSRIGPVLMFGLFALILFGILSIFFPAMQTGYALIGVIIFIAFTAYDTQKIRANYQYFSGDAVTLQKASIISALQLYLDFINLFLYLIRLFGKRN